MKMIKNWPKDDNGVHIGCCFLCRNTGITTWFLGAPPSSYCKACYDNGYFTLEMEE